MYKRQAFNGFRFKDFNDYSSATVQGDAVAYDDQAISVGDGVSLTYQVFKNYTTLTTTAQRKISKLVTGSLVIGFNGTTPGAWSIQDAGVRWSVDVDTGIITFSADIVKNPTSAQDQGGGLTRCNVAAHGLLVNDTVFLSTFTGDWAGLNGRRYIVVAKATNSFDITFDSSLYAAYSGNAGQTNTIPQALENITWGAEFDVPVRFASDGIQIEQISPGIEQASVELIEIK